MSALSQPPITPRAAQENIDQIVRLEEEAQQRRTVSERVADGIANFVGSMLFVYVHIVWFLVWVPINLGWIPFMKAFDPYPFALLCMIVSLEGVVLSTFVLIKQNRMSQRADTRSHLDLQVNLLNEKETTKIIQMIERMSRKMGIEEDVVDPEVGELGQVTAVENIARSLEDKLPSE
ncbi:MAG: DUF1003 domain-containing protein [Acidobacteriaceae bacterium]|nr:DUF1003 domain-containing protein [Acidobacteriaceae bacterium]MBV8573295.1 DUF1003 domain-containing protein [Acidobacteriaceae bacterium]